MNLRYKHLALPVGFNGNDCTLYGVVKEELRENSISTTADVGIEPSDELNWGWENKIKASF